jgi:hypothetical protein
VVWPSSPYPETKYNRCSQSYVSYAMPNPVEGRVSELGQFLQRLRTDLSDIGVVAQLDMYDNASDRNEFMERGVSRSRQNLKNTM